MRTKHSVTIKDLVFTSRATFIRMSSTLMFGCCVDIDWWCDPKYVELSIHFGPLELTIGLEWERA